MKKVLHVTMSNAYGGAETVIFSIIDKLNKLNDFYYLCPEGKIEEYLNKKKIKYKAINVNQFKKEIRKTDADIIHAHDFKASVLCSLLSKDKVVISHLHTSHKWIKKLSIKSIIYIIASFKFKNIIMVSKSMKEDTWFYKFIKNKTKVMLNTVDKEEVKYLAKINSPDENYDIAFLGRLSDYKNPLRFINIIEEIKNYKEDIKAVIIGDGELKTECIKKIKECNLENNIYMKGFLENPFPVIDKSKLLLMPSKVEALGLSAVQAMVLGKPVIATNVGGLKEIINEYNGVTCNSDGAFINNILNILEDKAKYDLLSDGAKVSSEKLCDVDKYMDSINYIYNE
ncbi:MAG: glycosyltransferase [Clostridium sp.]|uniref:glycosyltransferase n=1 Tax=Clostridium sp. TaxID=1506 RepID=UPI003F3D71D0